MQNLKTFKFETEGVKSFLEVSIVELAGFSSALEALRMPYKHEPRSINESSLEYHPGTDSIESRQWLTIHEKDIALLTTLVERGDEHAKCIRGIVVYMNINAPMYFWKQMDTYRFGTDRLASESTMHVDCKGLTDAELIMAQESVSGGYMQKRMQLFSYQTLRRIYKQRKDDRLPIWRHFCSIIETLPFAKEWITIGL